MSKINFNILSKNTTELVSQTAISYVDNEARRIWQKILLVNRIIISSVMYVDN